MSVPVVLFIIALLFCVVVFLLMVRINAGQRALDDELLSLRKGR